MATVKFRIRSTANKAVTIKVYLSTGRGSVVEVNTGFTIHPKEWSAATGLPKQNVAENKHLAASLQKLSSYLISAYNGLQSDGGQVDADWLTAKINECFNRVTKTEVNRVVEYVQHIIDTSATRKVKGRNNLGLSERRVSGYKSFKNILLAYEAAMGKKIYFLDISRPFCDKFRNWLLENRKYSVNYAGKQFDNLKTVCSDADRAEIPVNPYAAKIERFKENDEDRHIVTLSFAELEQIKNADLEGRPGLINARKWTLIGCEIGQRVGDLLEVKPENIRRVGNAVLIDVKQEKTGKHITAPVASQYVCDILENDPPYKVCDQLLNRRIKELCKIAGVVEVVESKKFNASTRRKEVGFYPKCEVISAHGFRRSFATNYYKMISTPVLMEITGHTKESTFLEYINKQRDKDANAALFLQQLEQMKRADAPHLTVIKTA